MNGSYKRLKRVAKSGIFAWILFLLIWITAAHFTSSTYLSGPLETLAGWREIIISGVYWEDLFISLKRIFLGWLRGIVIGIPVGLLIGRFKIFKFLVEPIVNFFRFVPAIGFLTLFLMWFGVGEASKLAIITYATMFPVIVNTIAGVSGIDPVKYQAAQSLGASQLQTFVTVTIPGTIPSIFTGIRLGLSGAVISIVGAEMLAANSGLGYLIYTSRMYFRTDWIFVGIVTLGLIGFLMDFGLRKLGTTLFKHYSVNDE